MKLVLEYLFNLLIVISILTKVKNQQNNLTNLKISNSNALLILEFQKRITYDMYIFHITDFTIAVWAEWQKNIIYNIKVLYPSSQMFGVIIQMTHHVVYI